MDDEEYDEPMMCECEQDWNCYLHKDRIGTWIETRYDSEPDYDTY